MAYRSLLGRMGVTTVAAASKKIGIRAKKVGHEMKHPVNSFNTPNDGSRVQTAKHAKSIGVRATGSSGQPDPGYGIGKPKRPPFVEKESHRPVAKETVTAPTSSAVCTLCGGKGHSAASHGSVKIGSKPEDGVTHGPATAQNQATQFGFNNGSPLTQGNANYRSPGYEGGMS